MKRNIKQTKRVAVAFLNWVILLVIFFIGSIALFNWLANPYRIFSTNNAETWSGLKPRPEQLQPELRMELARQAKGKTLFFGNSMFEIGIDPQSPLLATNEIRGFNFALAGAGLTASTKGLESYLRANKPTRAIISASFDDHISQRNNSVQNSSAEMPDYFNKGKLVALSLLGVEATLDSMKSLTLHLRKYPQSLTALGHNPMHDFEGYAVNSGYRVLFNTANQRIRSSFSKAKGSKPEDPTAENSVALAELEYLAKLLLSVGAEVTIVINPTHMNYLESIEESGLMDRFQAWKGSVARLSENLKIRAIDFGCEGALLSETIPEKGDRKTPMTYYWDAQHYKANVGSLMVLGILSSDSAIIDQDKLIGLQLFSTSIFEHNARCLKTLHNYKKTLGVN